VSWMRAEGLITALIEGLMMIATLRAYPLINTSFIRRRSRCDGVVPIRMEVAALHVEGGHFRLRDLDAVSVSVRVEFAGNLEAGRRGRGGDQLATPRWLVSGFARQS
jgi:hypothetical protein